MVVSCAISNLPAIGNMVLGTSQSLAASLVSMGHNGMQAISMICVACHEVAQ